MGELCCSTFLWSHFMFYGSALRVKGLENDRECSWRWWGHSCKSGVTAKGTGPQSRTGPQGWSQCGLDLWDMPVVNPVTHSTPERKLWQGLYLSILQMTLIVLCCCVARGDLITSCSFLTAMYTIQRDTWMNRHSTGHIFCIYTVSTKTKPENLLHFI